MNRPLAIFAPVVGARSETFIRRHMQDLFPGGTVVVADSAEGPLGGHWTVDSPALFLRRTSPNGWFRRIGEGVRRRIGRDSNRNLQRVERFLRDNGVRVVIGEYLDWSLPWMRAVHDAGARFFGHAHGYDVSMQLRNPRCRADYLGYNAAAGVITMSQISKAALVEVGVSAAKISVIPYGVDVPPKRVKRGAVGDTVRCLAVGRMVAKKAPIMTLDAIRRACDTYPALTFDYVGDGELMPAAQQFVRAFHLENRVTLHGGQSSKVVDRLMTDADVFVQHSMTDPLTGDEEGLPVAILEAMAHGLPVVSTKHSGIPEAVTHGETGFLVDEGDSAAMGACVAKLASDPGLRTRMGENGWLRAKKDFSWDRERTDLLKVLGLDDPWT